MANKALDQTPRKSRFFVKAWLVTQSFDGAGQLSVILGLYEKGSSKVFNLGDPFLGGYNWPDDKADIR